MKKYFNNYCCSLWLEFKHMAEDFNATLDRKINSSKILFIKSILEKQTVD